MYKAPTLSTAAVPGTSPGTLPKRQSLVLCNYYIPNNTVLSRGNFVSDKNGNPVELFYLTEKQVAKVDRLQGGLIALSSDSDNFTDTSEKIEKGYVRCNKPFYITHENRVFSNSNSITTKKSAEQKRKRLTKQRNKSIMCVWCFWRRSSAGQSVRFTSERSWVRAPSSPPAASCRPPIIGDVRQYAKLHTTIVWFGF